MEAGAVRLQRKPVDLWKLLDETVASLQVLANSNQQTLTLHLSNHLPIIEADTTTRLTAAKNPVDNIDEAKSTSTLPS